VLHWLPLTMGLVLNAANVDDCRRLLERGRGRELESVEPAGATLCGAFEFACARWQTQGQSENVLGALAKRWSMRHPMLSRAWNALARRSFEAVETHGAPTVEIQPAPTREELGELDWALFLQRFERALRVHGGFEKKLATGLSGALAEMAGNVVEHAVPQGRPPAPAIVGFHVEKDVVTYAVADLGRGVLASLRENPLWSHVRTPREALDAAVLQYATRRQNMRRGEGFRQVVRALADLQGHLRFRSGDAALIIDGRGQGREARQRRSPQMDGFQLAVRCSLQRGT
jgi:hypothetical protein